jgi:hypothetical protein
MTPMLRETLQRTSPLPEGWSELEVVEDVFVADGVELHRAGIASVAPDGEEVTGSAAEAGSSPAARSYFELLERAATVEALRDRRLAYELRTFEGDARGTCSADELFPVSDDPARWRYARSNGVALHTDWQRAAHRAFWELSERDRVLRSWYGTLRPQRLRFDLGATALAGAASYDWHAYTFPENDRAHFSRGVDVVGVFGFPQYADAPLVLGFGARDDAAAALDAATREATQLLAFLWGEPVTDHAPELGPTPSQHLERFQFPANHALLRRWLDGAHLAYGNDAPARTGDASPVAFVDLTPSWLGGGHRVAKAFCAAAMPLAFGDAPFGAHLPLEVRAHPIA